MTEFLLALVLFAAVAMPWSVDDGSPPPPMISYGDYYHPPPLDYEPAPVAKRDPKVVRAFRKVNACPSTQKFTGACAGWVVDHIIPLCWGGEDKPLNMQWQEVRASYIKDAFERAACAMKKKQGEL